MRLNNWNRQLAIGLLVALIFFLGAWGLFLNMFPPLRALVKAAVLLLSFTSLLMLHYYVFIPRLFQKGRWWIYGGVSAIIAAVFAVLRLEIEDTLDVLPTAIHIELAAFTYSELLRFFYYSQYIFITIITLLIHLLRMRLRSQLRENRLKQEKLQAELGFLKSQVNPHFLFNTLNNIYTLAYIQDPKTPEVILELAEMMRYLVEESKADTVTLKDEIRFLENYLELQKLKSPQYEQIELKYHQLNEASRIPPLLILPFFENLFKHSDLESNPSGWAKANLVQTDKTLIFSIENTFKERKNENVIMESEGGFGIQNVEQRLKLLYQNDYSLKTTASNTWKVELKIPIVS